MAPNQDQSPSGLQNSAPQSHFPAQYLSGPIPKPQGPTFPSPIHCAGLITPLSNLRCEAWAKGKGLRPVPLVPRFASRQSFALPMAHVRLAFGQSTILGEALPCGQCLTSVGCPPGNQHAGFPPGNLRRLQSTAPLCFAVRSREETHVSSRELFARKSFAFACSTHHFWCPLRGTRNGAGSTALLSYAQQSCATVRAKPYGLCPHSRNAPSGHCSPSRRALPEGRALLVAPFPSGKRC